MPAPTITPCCRSRLRTSDRASNRSCRLPRHQPRGRVALGLWRDRAERSSLRVARHRLYVWQDSPWRAREWALEQHGEDGAAVVAVGISLDGCLDLLNPAGPARGRGCAVRPRVPGGRRRDPGQPRGRLSGAGLRRHQLVLRAGGRTGPTGAVSAGNLRGGGAYLRGVGDPHSVAHPDRCPRPLGYP